MTNETPNAPVDRRPNAPFWIALAALAISVVCTVTVLAVTTSLAARVDTLTAQIAPEESSAPQGSPSGQAEVPDETAPQEPYTAETVIQLGSELKTPSARLTVHSAEVVEQIETIEGAPLVPGDGTQLVLLKTTYTVLGPDAVDLSCGGTGLYIRGYDSTGAEMPQLFETRKIPGNMACNQRLLTGQSSDWNIAFTMVAGNLPDHLLVVDSGISDHDTEWSLRLR